jgi:hypothetical protein
MFFVQTCHKIVILRACDFLSFPVFCTPNRMFFNPKQSRHPERSAAQTYRIENGLWRAVEEPVLSVAEGTPAMLVGRCPSQLSGHKLRGSPTPMKRQTAAPAFSNRIRF